MRDFFVPSPPWHSSEPSPWRRSAGSGFLTRGSGWSRQRGRPRRAGSPRQCLESYRGCGFGSFATIGGRGDGTSPAAASTAGTTSTPARATAPNAASPCRLGGPSRTNRETRRQRRHRHFDEGCAGSRRDRGGIAGPSTGHLLNLRERRRRGLDRFKNDVLQAAGVPVYRVRSRQAHDPIELAEDIERLLGGRGG